MQGCWPCNRSTKGWGQFAHGVLCTGYQQSVSFSQSQPGTVLESWGQVTNLGAQSDRLREVLADGLAKSGEAVGGIVDVIWVDDARPSRK